MLSSCLFQGLPLQVQSPCWQTCDGVPARLGMRGIACAMALAPSAPIEFHLRLSSFKLGMCGIACALEKSGASQVHDHGTSSRRVQDGQEVVSLVTNWVLVDRELVQCGDLRECSGALVANLVIR